MMEREEGGTKKEMDEREGNEVTADEKLEQKMEFQEEEAGRKTQFKGEKSDGKHLTAPKVCCLIQNGGLPVLLGSIDPEKQRNP